MSFKIGDSVTFRPFPRALANVTAKVVGIEGQFLVTQDADGKQRKVRPGAARAA